MGKFNKKTKDKEKRISEEAQRKFNPSSRNVEENEEIAFEDVGFKELEKQITRINRLNRTRKKPEIVLEKLEEEKE